jgi:hypothetical protein
MKPLRASIIVAGLWTAVALVSCGVGGEEGTSDSTSVPAVASVSSSSETSNSNPAFAVSQYPSVAFIGNQATEDVDNESADSSAPEGDDEEAAAVIMLTRE